MVTRRNSLLLLLAIELMLNAANLSLVSFAIEKGSVLGQIQVFFVITLAAAETAIGLSLLINLYRHFGSLNTGMINTMKG
jgi:NADH-quinone oxidoreductase subunit K